jgi:hypothetical protein
MALKVKCKCGAVLAVGPELAGRLGTCLKCGKTMRIPLKLPGTPGVSEEAKTTLHFGRDVAEVPIADAAGEEAVGLDVLSWPSIYLKGVVIIAAAVLVVGAAVAGYLMLRPAAVVREAPAAKAVLSEPASGFKMTLPEGWEVKQSEKGALKAVNGKLDAELVVYTGARRTLNEFSDSFLKSAEARPEYSLESIATPSDARFGPVFTMIYSYRPEGAQEKRKVLVRAFSAQERSFSFELTASLEDWPIAREEFDAAWATIQVGGAE